MNTRTDAGHGHDHTAGASARRLTIALILTATFLIAEVIGGLVFNSLALLSDAAHMFTDVMALAIALIAIKVGQKPADDRRTFGYRRFEILAAAFNAALLFVVAGYVLWEGVQRLREPEPVGSVGMLVVAALGLIVNVVSMRILASGKDRSLNVKGAYLEVWADMLGSLGVLGAAATIMLTGWRWVDPIVAIGIGLWVLPRTWILLKETTHVLLEGAPKGLRIGDVREALEAVPGVAGVHDLHAWVSGSDEPSFTAHLVIQRPELADRVQTAARTLLADRYGLHHVTLQVELAGRDDPSDLHR